MAHFKNPGHYIIEFLALNMHCCIINSVIHFVVHLDGQVFVIYECKNVARTKVQQTMGIICSTWQLYRNFVILHSNSVFADCD